MVNSRRKVQVVSKLGTEKERRNLSSTSIPYFRGLTEHLQHTETMKFESGTISLDHEDSVFLLGCEKEKTESLLPNFVIKRYEEI